MLEERPRLLIVFYVHWSLTYFISIYFIFLQEHSLFTDHVDMDLLSQNEVMTQTSTFYKYECYTQHRNKTNRLYI